MNSQFLADAACHHHFKNICDHIDAQANGEDHSPLPDAVCGCKRGGIDQPEKDHTWVQCIDEKAGKDGFGEI